ncbi:MAG: phosphatidylglycerol lysyltransferase domain-containing protein, partial [Pseudooceanicola nanhaiensis]
MMRQRARAVAAQRIIRVAGPLGFGAICLMLLGDRLSGIEAQAVLSTLREVHPLQWLAALAATWVSFWAVGRYDAVVHGSLGTGIARREAMRAGAAAIALAQVLGLGVVTGALARWRMLPGLSAFDAARVSGAVALSFLAGWAVVAAAAELLLPSGIMPWAVALAILGLAAALAVLAVLRGEVRLRGRRIRLPSLPAMTTILGLTALDT